MESVPTHGHVLAAGRVGYECLSAEWPVAGAGIVRERSVANGRVLDAMVVMIKSAIADSGVIAANGVVPWHQTTNAIQ